MRHQIPCVRKETISNTHWARYVRRKCLSSVTKVSKEEEKKKKKRKKKKLPVFMIACTFQVKIRTVHWNTDNDEVYTKWQPFTLPAMLTYKQLVHTFRLSWRSDTPFFRCLWPLTTRWQDVLNNTGHWLTVGHSAHLADSDTLPPVQTRFTNDWCEKGGPDKSLKLQLTFSDEDERDT